MGDPSCSKEDSDTKKRVQENIRCADTESTSKIKLQLELSVQDEQQELTVAKKKMSGKIFNTVTGPGHHSDQSSATFGDNTNNSVNLAGVHQMPGSCVGGGGPEMTSTPSSEYEPHSFGNDVGSGRNSLNRGQGGVGGGINLHLDLRRCPDMSATGHPLQRVVTPSPVATPTAHLAWNEFPLSSKHGHGLALNRPPFSGQPLKEEGKNSLAEEDYCQCKDQGQQQYQQRKKPPIFTTQESVHEPTAGLRQYPNGQRYLCTTCRNEVMSEHGKCASCPHSTDCSTYSSLESNGHQGLMASTVCQQLGQTGMKRHDAVITMPPHSHPQHCDMQNRENDHMVSFYADGYGRKDAKQKCRWLRKPYILYPICMFLCAIIAVGIFYLLTNRTPKPNPLPTTVKDSNNNNTGDEGISNPLMKPLRQDRICVKCLNLILSNDPQDDFTKTLQKVPNPKDKDNEDEMLCCARSPSQLQQILDAIFETRTRQDQNYGPSRPITNITTVYDTRNNLAALLYLGEVSKKPDLDTSSKGEADSSSQEVADASSEEEEDSNRPRIDNPEILYGWTNVTQSNAGFIRPNIIFDEKRGRLKVTQSGLYHIYTKLSFRPDPQLPDCGMIFSQKVMKEHINSRRTGPVELLRDTQYSPCPHVDTTHPCHSSSVSAVVYLKRGDELFVKASHRSQIMRDKLSSYFGLYYID